MTKLTDSETVLSHLINQLQYSEKIDKVIIATTEKLEDDVIVDFAKEKKITRRKKNSKQKK